MVPIQFELCFCSIFYQQFIICQMEIKFIWKTLRHFFAWVVYEKKKPTPALKIELGYIFPGITQEQNFKYWPGETSLFVDEDQDNIKNARGYFPMHFFSASEN